MKKLLYLILFVPLALFAQENYSSNKIGLLGGGNYFSESRFQGLGVASSIVYETHLYKNASIAGEVFYSFNSLSEASSALSGGFHRFGLFIGPSIKLQDNILRAFLRIGITQEKYSMALDKTQLFFGDQIDPNYGFIFQTSENLLAFPDNINNVDNVILCKFGLDGFYKLYKNLNLEYALGYIFTKRRYYENAYLTSSGEFANLSSLYFTIGASYNILKK